jgi:2-polyprenyl-6-methoxyphenol hydroxylase-like FAD-dependent oxidoreductase
MPHFIRKHVIVVGAGMGGLAAAKALSAHFDQVTMLERDRLPSDATPRQGTPQARHLHALLAGGLLALNELLPGIETELEQAGAVRLTPQSLRLDRPGFDPYPQRDLGLSWLSISRPMLE